MKWKRDRAGNRGREGGVIIYQVFGCAWQRRKLISTLCVHQLHSQASQGIPLACLCEAGGGHTDTFTLWYLHTHRFTQLHIKTQGTCTQAHCLFSSQTEQTHKIVSKKDSGITTFPDRTCWCLNLQSKYSVDVSIHMGHFRNMLLNQINTFFLLYFVFP